MNETDGPIRTQTRTQDATPSTPNTATSTPTGHGTPGPRTSGRHLFFHHPGQEDHHQEAGAFCQEKEEEEFHARHVGRGTAGRL